MHCWYERYIIHSPSSLLYLLKHNELFFILSPLLVFVSSSSPTLPQRTEKFCFCPKSKCENLRNVGNVSLFFVEVEASFLNPHEREREFSKPEIRVFLKPLITLLFWDFRGRPGRLHFIGKSKRLTIGLLKWHLCPLLSAQAEKSFLYFN